MLSPNCSIGAPLCKEYRSRLTIYSTKSSDPWTLSHQNGSIERKERNVMGASSLVIVLKTGYAQGGVDQAKKAITHM